jgi:hypothetical protein
MRGPRSGSGGHELLIAQPQNTQNIGSRYVGLPLTGSTFKLSKLQRLCRDRRAVRNTCVQNVYANRTITHPGSLRRSRSRPSRPRQTKAIRS